MFSTKVMLCRQRRLLVAWNGWRPKGWYLFGFHKMPYDGVYYWSLNLGPITFYNDWVRVREADLAEERRASNTERD